MGKTPKEIRDASSGVATHGNIIHSSTSDTNDQSIGVLAEDISRIQAAAHVYSESLTYKIDDVVRRTATSLQVYKNITAVTTPETFNSAKWRLMGVGAKFGAKGELLGYTGSSVNTLDAGSNNQVLTADNSQLLGFLWKTPVQYSSPVTTKGDIFGYDSEDKRIPVGSNDQVLTADSTKSLGVDWKTHQSSILIYSESLTYKVGDIIHLSSPTHQTFRNITPVTTPEAFDSTKWQLMGVEDLFTAKGELLVYFGTATSNFAAGSNGQILSADSTIIPGLRWIQPAWVENWSSGISNRCSIYGSYINKTKEKFVCEIFNNS